MKREICNIKRLPHDFNSFWFSTLITMIFYSSYSRKLIYYKKIFENNYKYNEQLFIILNNFFNKNIEYVEKFNPTIFNKIFNITTNYFNINNNIIEHINKLGYIKSLFIHHFFDYLNINYLILDYYKDNFYVGYSENIELLTKYNKSLYTDKLSFNSNLDNFVNYIKNKINNTIPEYIIVNIFNDTFISNSIDNFNETRKINQNLNYYNIKIDGLDTFEKFIILNGHTYILDSVSFDYNYNESIVGIHCNNKKFIFDEKSRFFNKEWTFINSSKKPKMTMLIYVLYETKNLNTISCYSSVNNYLFDNHWFNCFLTMIFKSSYSKNLLYSIKLFTDYNDELTLFFNNILKNNKIIKNYKINKIINLFDLIKDKNKLFKYINHHGYPINNFLPFFFKKFEIDYLMLDYYKKKFYIGFSENYYYQIDDNNVIHTKFRLPNNNDIDEYSEYLNDEVINNSDFVPFYIVINIHNDSNNYIDNFNDNYNEKLKFDYYKPNIKGINSFKDIIIYNGYKYKLDSISLNNSPNYDKINNIDNSIIGINCNDNKYVYNGVIGADKDPNRKLPCKLINYNWNIKNKSYFYIDNEKCKINRTNKSNNDTNNFSFNNGFRILIYVLLIDEYKYESNRFDYFSKSNLSYQSISSDHKKDIALSPIIFKDDIKDDIKKSSSSSSKLKKLCPNDKIYNSKTKRCVKKEGKIGRELLNKIN